MWRLTLVKVQTRTGTWTTLSGRRAHLDSSRKDYGHLSVDLLVMLGELSLHCTVSPRPKINSARKSSDRISDPADRMATSVDSDSCLDTVRSLLVLFWLDHLLAGVTPCLIFAFLP